MKKEWNIPTVTDLSIRMTELSPRHNKDIDGEYIDDNGNYWNSRLS